MTLDRDWHIGVSGWKVDGQHIRLKDVLDSGGGEAALQEHRNALVWLALVYYKLKDELDEVENEVYLQREGQADWEGGPEGKAVHAKW